jgi:hypothetical protein
MPFAAQSRFEIICGGSGLVLKVREDFLSIKTYISGFPPSVLGAGSLIDLSSWDKADVDRKAIAAKAM